MSGVSTAFVWDHRGRTRKNAEGPIEYRVTIDRKSWYVATGVKCLRSEWKFGVVVDLLLGCRARMGKHRGGRWGCGWGRGGVGGTPLHGVWLRCGVGRHGRNRRGGRGMCMWRQVGHGL